MGEEGLLMPDRKETKRRKMKALSLSLCNDFDNFAVVIEAENIFGKTIWDSSAESGDVVQRSA